MKAIFELVEIGSSNMTNIVHKRREVELAYDGKKWQDKVRKMSDQQIVAVFLRLQQQGRIKA